MRSHRRSLTALLVAAPIALAARADGQTFPEAGARALGLGGAYIAVAEGPTGSYWNPAASALGGPVGGFVYGRTTIDGEGFAVRLDDLAATDARALDINRRVPDAARAVELLGAINSEPQPILGQRPVGAFYSGGSYGLSIYRMKLVEAEPLVDVAHVELSDDPSRGLRFNESRLLLSSLEFTDYVFSVGSPLGDPSLLVGGSVRWSRGKARTSAPSLFDFPEFSASDVFDAASDGTAGENKDEVSFDVGMLSVHEHVRVGLVGKYLGSPTFPTAVGTEFEIEPRWRAGLAVLPSPQVLLSVDLDLTETALAPDDREQRLAAFGAEFRGLNGQLALRGGLREPLTGPGEIRLVTGGVGFRHPGGFSLDFAAGFQPGSDNLALAFEFGFRKTGNR